MAHMERSKTSPFLSTILDYNSMIIPPDNPVPRFAPRDLEDHNSKFEEQVNSVIKLHRNDSALVHCCWESEHMGRQKSGEPHSRHYSDISCSLLSPGYFMPVHQPGSKFFGCIHDLEDCLTIHWITEKDGLGKTKEDLISLKELRRKIRHKADTRATVKENNEVRCTFGDECQAFVLVYTGWREVDFSKALAQAMVRELPLFIYVQETGSLTSHFPDNH
ncbi:hypothetical protein EDD86DRAFT_212751 [Gorgonomyces haynaldii]|nr:hypothetical protein EDD86DRAFT_212751 [Gorgonomyces haynaldii]